MAQQNTYQPAILAAIDAEIAVVQTDYKAALAAAGAELLATQSRSRASRPPGSAGVLVEEALPEIDSDLAVALHKFETRLDQLKELRDWIKIDPELAQFAARLEFAPKGSAAPAPAALSSPSGSSVPTPRSRGIPTALVAVVALLALVVGWLVSLALPAASLLPH